MSFYGELLQDKAENNNIKGQQMLSVTTGKVVKNWDDKHPGMVQVELYLGESGKNCTDWVRVAQPYAGKEYGFFFLPEVGDEVVLAFNQGDRDHPIVIGSLWSQVNKLPPKAATEKNEQKVLHTKGGNSLVFADTDKKQSVKLSTAGELTLIMEDDPVTINLCDKNKKNILTIDGKNGAVTLQADKKLVLKVGSGTLTLDGTGKKATLKMDNVNVEATQGLTMKGQNVKLEGSMLTVSASGNLEVKSNGMLTLKGSMTKIN